METKEITIENLLKANEDLTAENERLNRQVQWLMEQFRLLKHQQFGPSSEQTNPDQLNLFNEAEQAADINVPEPEISKVREHYRKKTRLITDKLPEDLPVEVIEHQLPEEERVCPDCGSPLHKMGEETREELKIIPAKAVILRHVRYVYSCRHCEEASDHVPIVKADMPSPVIKGGFASPEAIAHIAAQKFMMGSPLYRQEKEWEQNGILLSRQTMSNWLIKACDCLFPIYDEMKRRLCEHQVLHADETTLQVLHEDGKAAQSKSYMWLYRTSGEAERQIVLYDYKPDRKTENPKEFLRGFRGYLHADGYEGYHRLPDNINVVGCWAHARRKFTDILKTIPKDKWHSTDAGKGVAYCDKLFLLEKQFALLMPEERFKEREKKSKPLIDEFYAWLGSLHKVAPKSLLGKAAYYAASQREYLERYLLDGRLEISNNRAERSIKPFVIGRKNWLFSNTPAGARSSAVFYSLIISAEENGLNPFEYLTWILTNAPNLGKPGYISKIEDFLPGSGVIPQKVFSLKPKEEEPHKYPWEGEE